MLKKIGVIPVSLLVLIGVSSFVYCQEEAAGEGGPSISELREVVREAERRPVDVDARLAEAEAKLEEGKPSVARQLLQAVQDQKLTRQQQTRLAELQSKVDDALARQEARIEERLSPEEEKALTLAEQLRLKEKVKQELRKARARELVEEARFKLYYEEGRENTLEAYELARKALELDPENKEARQLRITAGLDLGIEAEERVAEAEHAARVDRVRVKSAQHLLKTQLATARRLYEEGKFEEALRTVRSAQGLVATLSSYMDVSREQKEVENLLGVIQDAHEERQKKLVARRRVEAERAAEKWAEERTEQEQKRRDRQLEEVEELIRQKNWDAAEKLIDDLEVEDPADTMVKILRRRLSEQRHAHEMGEINAARDRGDLVTEQWEAERQVSPERKFNYPEKAFWVNVVEKREREDLYPSLRLKRLRSEEDQTVDAKLDKTYDFPFQEPTALTQVVEWLRQVSEVPFVIRGDISGAPDVNFPMNTTLRNGLDHITEMTDTRWKIDRGAVVIGPPEKLADYELRVYPVLDLLLSFEDAGAGEDDGGEGGFGGFGGGGGTTGGGGTLLPQFGGGGGDDEDEEDRIQLFERADDLITLLQRVCAEERWQFLGTRIAAEVSGREGGEGAFGEEGGGFGMGGGFTGGGAAGGMGGFGGPGMEEMFGGGGGFGFGMEEMPAPGAQPQVTRFMERMPGAGYMSHQPGTIIVYDTEAVHKCIEGLLEDLRRRMKIQVNIDLRFLTVQTDFLREVGFQWDDFILDKNSWASDGEMTNDFNVMSGAYGGFSPWPFPILDAFITGFDDNGFPIYASRGTVGQTVKMGNLWPDPAGSLSPEGVTTYTKTPLTGTPFIGTGIPGVGIGSGMSLNLGFQSGESLLSGVFRLANERNAMRTLSAPQITLTNGQEGYIVSSTETYYISGYEVQDGIPTPERTTAPTSIGLIVRPVVSEDLRYVFLELQPVRTESTLVHATVPVFLGVEGGNGENGGGAIGERIDLPLGLPIISSDVLQTTVGVPDRGVVVVGGLSKSNRSQHEAGVPVLDKIPILKRLFSGESRTADRQTLFIMARPHIIILSEEEQRMS